MRTILLIVLGFAFMYPKLAPLADAGTDNGYNVYSEYGDSSDCSRGIDEANQETCTNFVTDNN